MEGYVDVVFDVTPSGSVTNIRIIDSSHAGFEKSAIEAAQRFRYKPRMLDGMPVGDTGIRYRFRFRMER